jgi:hypothetical protein
MARPTEKIQDINELKTIIASHLNQAAGTTSIDSKFIFLWRAFNVYGTYFSKENSDQKMIDWMKKKSLFNRFFLNSYLSRDFQNCCAHLKALSPIHDMRPNPKPSLVIQNSASPSEILDAIYRIRCNLTHGSKIMENARDRELVSISFEILSKVAVPMLLSI